MRNRLLWQILGLVIFLCMTVALSNFFEYLRALQGRTYQLYTAQAGLGVIMTITTGTVCLFLDQIVEKIKNRDKRFDFKMFLFYAVPALCFVFSIKLVSLVGLNSFCVKILFYHSHTRIIGAFLLGLGIVRALCPLENRVEQEAK